MYDRSKAMTALQSDTAIIELMARDREAGFRALLARYMRPVYWHVRRLVVDHDDAEDVVQETFVRVLSAADRLDASSGSLRAWVYRIATNEALRHLERRPAVRLDDAAEAASLPADEYVDYADVEAVRLQQAIHTLPPRQQAVFNMRYFDGMTYDDISAVTDSPVSALKANYHLAKQKIIKILTQ